MRLGHLDNGHLDDMKYITELSHEDFVLVMSVLRKCEEQNEVFWSPTQMICENTKVQY